MHLAKLLVLCLVLAPLAAQDYRHIDQVQVPASYETLEEWLGRAEEIRTHILVSAGLWPMPAKTPLNPRLTDPINRGDYSVQAVTLEVWPEFYLVGNLYRPLGRQGPFPALLSSHGHWDQGRFEDTETASVPGRAINFAKQGFVVFTYSMIGYNEMEPFVVHRFEQTKERQIWGFSPMGLQLWNSIRALDFICSLPDVDPARVGMTGASGGGTQTFLLTAVDSRVRVAAPVNMISAHFQGGCVCENGPLLRMNCNNVEIGGLAAPRPLLMISTSGDWTKNTPQIEFPAMQQIYRLFGFPDRVANVHLNYEHNYNKDSREAAYAWFSRWLLGTKTEVREQPFTVEERKKLEARLPQTPVTLEVLLRRFSRQADAQIEDARPANWPGILAFRETYGTALTHVLETGPWKLAPEARLNIPEDRSTAVPALLVVHPPEKAEKARELEQRYSQQGWIVATLSPYPESRRVRPPEDIEHWTTYNPTPPAIQVAEIRELMRQLLDRRDVTSLDVIGLDSCGPLVLLARALEPRVAHTSIDFPYPEVTDELLAETLFIPLLRRAGDFRTAAVMTAPGALTVHGLRDQRLRSWMESVYRAAGAREMLRFQAD
ncbi:MAG TPA: acetylxylan esterase [Acidobacteriota bacterium]|nr:acetylxylan esterase [Acidobacteriota bacterium]